MSNHEMINNHVQIPITIPMDVDDAQQYILQLTIQNNDIFANPEPTNIKINISNKKNITVDTTQPISSSNVHTLQNAINLVDNYGTINIESDINDENIILDKSITIQGNNHTFTNTNITNNAPEVLITNIISDTSRVINNAEIMIDSCSFNNNTDSAIVNNNKITIHECHFNNNNADYGACVYIANQNASTIIDKCEFTGNKAQYYGGCIYSNKGNDTEITNCAFYNNNKATYNGTCISIYGNAYISGNTFYENDADSNNEIYLMNGSIEMDKNIFDGAIDSINILHGVVDADLNYWGYNTEAEIQTLEDKYNIEINNYLISRCDIIPRDDNTYYAVGIIDEYRNKFEIETTKITPIQSNLPVSVGSAVSSLNHRDIIVQNQTFKMRIGQAEVPEVAEQ